MLLVLLSVLVAVSAAADAPPAPSAVSEPAASAWACTKKTLLEDLPCTVEGRTTAQAPSREQAKENLRQAKVLTDELCNAVALGDGVEPAAGILAVCLQRAPAALKRCGGDGSRRLLDDAGRFNPGHAKCYGALADLVRGVSALVDTAQDCCTCLHDSCQVREEQCVARMADDRAPDAPAACLQGTCATACAQVQLFSPDEPATRKP